LSPSTLSLHDALPIFQPLWASAPSTPQASWNNLGNLARGDVVKVVVSRGSAQRGVFQSVTGDTMVVHFPTGDQTFERQTVTQVLVKREGRRGRHVLIGLLVEQVWDWARALATMGQPPTIGAAEQWLLKLGDFFWALG